MHDQPTCEPGSFSPVRDESYGNAVLRHLLITYPAAFSVDEVAAELTDPQDGFGERDGVSRAIRDLTRSRVLHQHGSFVWAARAAKAALVLDEG